MQQGKDDLVCIHPSLSILWKIRNFSGRAKKTDQFIKSPPFQFQKTYWSIFIYPNGDSEHLTMGKVGVYLVKNSATTEEQEMSFDFTIIDCYGDCAFFSPHSVTFTKQDDSYGTSNLVERKMLCSKSKFRFLPKDTLTLRCNLSFISKQKDANTLKTKEKVNKAKNFPKQAESWKDNSLCEDFEALYNNSLLADVTLKVGSRDFLAHKAVLSIRSKVFKTMLESNMKESRDNCINLIEMEAQTVQDMLRFIYCGKVGALSPDQALNLFVAADRYDLQELKSRCRNIVLENLSVENLPEIVIVADLHNDKLLLDAGRHFLSKNMKEVMKTEKWKYLKKENLAFYMELIESVVLNE